MKKYINNIMLLLLGMFVVAACSDDSDDYKGASVSGEQVYFSNTLSQQINLSNTETSFTVPVARVKTDDAITVKIELADETKTFTAPATVTFDAGSKTADIVISYDPKVIGYDNYVEAKLTITDEAYLTAYGKSEYTFKAGIPSPYVSIGKGKFSDAFFSDMVADVEIMQNQEDPTVYRIMHPYDAIVKEEVGGLSADGSQDDYIQIKLQKAGDELGGVTLTMDNLVYFSYTLTGFVYDELASQIAIAHASEFASLSAEENYSCSRVLAFQDDGSIGRIQLAPRYHLVQDGRGWGYQSKDGMIIIDFPGFVEKDYNVTFSYQGRQSDIFGTAEFVYGILAMGADIASVKMAIATEETYDDVLAGLKDGTVDGVTVEQSGAVQIPGVDATGYYYVVMVGFDADGEAVTSADSRIFYVSGKEQWTKLYDGTYTYEADIIELLDDNYSFYEGTVTSAVYKSTTTEGLYTIKPWGNAEANFGLVFNWDTETNEIWVEGADTGDEDIYEIEGETYNDGKVTFYTLDMLGVPMTSSYDPETKTFTFNGCYVNEEEYFYGGVVETFVINDAPAFAPKFLKRAPQFKAHAKKQKLTFPMKRTLSRIKLQNAR